MPEPKKSRGSRLCPVCHAEMMLTKKGKVEIDACEDHGVWLDRGELEAMLQRSARRERIRSRHEVRRARNSGKVSGWLFGALAFLFD